MKKTLLFTILIANISVSAWGSNLKSTDQLPAGNNQSTSSRRSYKTTTIYNAPSGQIGYTQTEYYDGLGNPIETIQRGFSPSKKDIVSFGEYNAQQRLTKAWLGIPMETSDGAYIPIAELKDQAIEFYQDANPYKETLYQANPIERISTTYQPGAVFHDNNKAVQTTYGTNDVNIRLMAFSKDSLVIFNSFYTPGSLYKVTVTNEDGDRMETYTDHTGKIVMTRSGNDTDTYYVYDRWNRLSVVITPEGLTPLLREMPESSFSAAISLNSEAIQAYCFYYRYDEFGNIIEKHIPGGYSEEMEYDERGLLKTLFQGKRLQKGIEIEPYIEYAEQFSYDDLNRLTDIRVASFTVDSNNNRIPLPGGPTNLLASYKYDTYSSVPTALQCNTLPTEFGSIDRYRIRGLKTYEKISAVNNGGPTKNYVERAFYYNNDGHIAAIIERNHRGGINRFFYKYDFLGNIIYSQENISQPEGSTDTREIRYTYDHAGRLLSEVTRLNSKEATVTYIYDELGRLSSKTINGENDLKTTYAYNMQGMLTDQENLYFSASLRYYDPLYGTSPSYSGNISEWDFRNYQNCVYTYAFTYDDLCRLTDSQLYEDGVLTNTNTERNITYNKNGNIKTLDRSFQGNQSLEELRYTYADGRLKTVSGANYEYDSRGRITYDGRNQIRIIYNFIDLPLQITDDTTGDIAKYEYLYDGTKLSSLDANGNGFLYMGSLVYNVINGGTPTLESAPFGGGRIQTTQTSSGQAYHTYCYLTDHLGNVRTIVGENGAFDIFKNYYPFGKRWKSPDSPTSSRRYEFNGKETQWIANASLLDYGARFYDPEIARWHTIDPKADDYLSISPYAYCANNPVKYIDPTGERLIIYDEDGTRYEWRQNDTNYRWGFYNDKGGEYEGDLDDRFFINFTSTIIQLNVDDIRSMASGSNGPGGGLGFDDLKIMFNSEFYLPNSNQHKKDFFAYWNPDIFTFPTQNLSDHIITRKNDPYMTWIIYIATHQDENLISNVMPLTGEYVLETKNYFLQQAGIYPNICYLGTDVLPSFDDYFIFYNRGVRPFYSSLKD